MDNEKFFQELDAFFEKNQIEEAGTFLEKTLEEARNEGNLSLEISVLNEMMGYYRSTDQEEKGLRSVEEGLSLIRNNGLETHPAVANMWINLGTTLCHFERVDEAEVCYKNAELFLVGSASGALNKASLYNNTAAIYVKTGRFDEAKARYQKALETLNTIDENSEFWEDLMYNRIVTWLNIVVMNRVKMEAEQQENDLQSEKEIMAKIEDIKEVLALDEFKNSSSFPYAVKKCIHCFENLGDTENKKWVESITKTIKT